MKVVQVLRRGRTEATIYEKLPAEYKSELIFLLFLLI